MCKNYITSLLLLCTALAASFAAFGMQADFEAKLREKYQAPAELAAILDAAYESNEANIKECLRQKSVCKCPRNLPCYIKTNSVMPRIHNLDKLRTLFAQQQLDELILPEKYLWRDYVVAEELVPAPDECNILAGITKKQLAQLMTLSKEGGFSDFIGGRRFGCANVYFSQDRPGKKFWQKNFKSPANNTRKIAIIDTKWFTFGNFDTNDLWELLTRGTHKNECDNAMTHGMMRIHAHDGIAQLSFEEFWKKWEHCFR